MTGQEDSPLIRSKPMTGGDGTYSYSKNSSYQGGIIDITKKIINEAIKEKFDFEKMRCIVFKTISIADLGCSIGPNTFFTVKNIIQAIERKYQNENKSTSSNNLEFQVFFNDHIENDFNTLFKTLHSNCKYFVAGVPGSFHHRLFPKSSIHFAHSSYTLHWLSTIPKEVVDKNSSAYNKDNIHCTGFNNEVAKVYAHQFKNDFSIFLNARAQELIPGGLMAIVKLVLLDGILMSQSTGGMFFDFLGSTLRDMANLGIISAEKLDSFNLPIYFPHVSELKELIEENGYFTIEKFEQLSNPMRNALQDFQVMTFMLRSVIEGIIKDQFGEANTNKIFEHFAHKFENERPNIYKDSLNNIELFIVLKRNVN